MDEKEFEYDITIGIDIIEFFDEENRSKFMNDFDSMYYPFLKEMGDLLYKWRIKKIDTYTTDFILDHYLSNREL